MTDLLAHAQGFEAPAVEATNTKSAFDPPLERAKRRIVAPGESTRDNTAGSASVSLATIAPSKHNDLSRSKKADPISYSEIKFGTASLQYNRLRKIPAEG